MTSENTAAAHITCPIPEPRLARDAVEVGDEGPHWCWALIWVEDAPPSEVWVHCHAESPPEGALHLKAALPLREGERTVRIRGVATHVTERPLDRIVGRSDLPPLRGLFGTVAKIASFRRAILERLRDALEREDRDEALAQARCLVGLGNG